MNGKSILNLLTTHWIRGVYKKVETAPILHFKENYTF